MTDSDDEKQGRSREYPLSSFVEAIEAEDGMASTTDVADYVGCSYELAYKRLHELADADRVSRTEIGNSHAWMVNDQ